MTGDLELRYVEPDAALGFADRLQGPVDVFSYADMRDTYARRLVAFRGDRAVGMFVFRICWGQLRARGTAIVRRHRGTGIGTALWLRALDDHRVKSVSVCVVSARALRMLRHIETLRPKVRIHARIGCAGEGCRAPAGAAAWKRAHP